VVAKGRSFINPMISGEQKATRLVKNRRSGYIIGGNCPSGRRCRYSDSAFVDYSVVRVKDIARTAG